MPEYRTKEERKIEINNTIKKIDEIGLHPNNTPELIEVYKLFSEYIKNDVDISKTIDLPGVGKKLTINLYKNKRAECCVILRAM